jgi:hypothetical protein
MFIGDELQRGWRSQLGISPLTAAGFHQLVWQGDELGKGSDNMPFSQVFIKPLLRPTSKRHTPGVATDMPGT